MAAAAAQGASLDDADGATAIPQSASNGASVVMAGTVASVRGDASVLRADEVRETLATGTPVGVGDVIETGSAAVIGIDFTGQTGLAMGANSILVVEDLAPAIPDSAASARLSIPEGTVAFVGGTREADAVLIETPAGTLSVGQGTGCFRTFPNGRIELVLLPDGDGSSGELVVTNGAGRFVIDTAFVVFVFNYTTAPVADDLVPLDAVLSEFAAPLAALAAIGFASIEQFMAGLVLEDGDGFDDDDDSGLQLAGSDAVLEPGRAPAVIPIGFNVPEEPRLASEIGAVAQSNRGTEFILARSPSGTDGRGTLVGPATATAPSASSLTADALNGSSPGTTNGSSGGESALAPSSNDPSGSGDPSDSNGPSGSNDPSGSGSSSESAGSPGSAGGPADSTTPRLQLIGTPFDDVFPIADHDNFRFIELIDGREGFDTILGTDGDDVLDFSAPDAPVLISIEMIDGGRGNDTIIGTSGDDVIHGGKGDDVLDGGPGNDSLNGGDGNDILNGGDGDDILDGNDGDDILYGGDGNDILIGNDGDDTLYGGDGDDIFIVRGRTDGLDFYDGGPGTDTIRGTERDDIVYVLDRLANIVSIEFIDGGSGFDIIRGTDGDDVLDFSVLDAPVLISIEMIDGGLGNDTVIGTAGDDVVHGGPGRDTLFGGLGNDILDGSEGDDVLRGGPGNDTLTGGTGSDTFLFSPGDGNNIITDFNRRDTVRLEGFAPWEVADAEWDGSNSILVAGTDSDQVSITIQGYSVTDRDFNLVVAYDSTQASA